jgi:hypothetical protein
VGPFEIPAGARTPIDVVGAINASAAVLGGDPQTPAVSSVKHADPVFHARPPPAPAPAPGRPARADGVAPGAAPARPKGGAARGSAPNPGGTPFDWDQLAQRYGLPTERVVAGVRYCAHHPEEPIARSCSPCRLCWKEGASIGGPTPSED